MSNNYDYFVKCLVIGDTYVGKTSLCNKLTNYNTIDDVYDPTIGIDLYYTYKNINWNDWKIHLWDTSGYTGFSKIIESYYSNSAICILMFDINDLDSFKHINYKIDQIKSINSTIFMVVLGNKNDTREEKDCEYYYTKTYYIDFFKQFDIPYYDISVKKNIGISGLLESIISRYSKKIKLSNIISKIDGTTNTIGLQTPPKINIMHNCVDDSDLLTACLIKIDDLCTIL